MKLFKKIMYDVLFASFAVMFLSSFFFGVELFEAVFGLSFVVMALDSIVLSAVELSTDGLPNPYDSDEYYID